MNGAPSEAGQRSATTTGSCPRRLRGWWTRLRELVANDETSAPRYFALSSIFWIFAFTGNHLSRTGFLLLVPIAVVAAVLFTAVPLGAQVGQRARTIFFLVHLLPYVAAALILHGYVMFLGTYVAMAAAVLLPLVWAVAVPLVVGGLMAWEATRIDGGDGVLFTLGCTAAMMGVTMAFSLDRTRRERTLADAQQRNAVLAVAAERTRIGRDLHDILGHSLTTIAVKGDLAARLMERDPDAARAQIIDLVTVARQALADTRATASGLREVRVASEVASARSVLEAAGITAHTPTAMPVLDEATSELFGYVVREGVTNVVRHAAATQCWIHVGADAISVADDGQGSERRREQPRGTGTASSGLAGLRDRGAASGFRVELERRTLDDDLGRPVAVTVLSCTRQPEGGTK